MIFNNKTANKLGITKNLLPNFNDSRWFSDVSNGGGILNVDSQNSHKATLTIDYSAQGRLINIPVKLGQAYTFSFKNIVGLFRIYKGRVVQHDANRVLVQDATPSKFTFVVDASYGGTITIRITNGIAGTNIFENMQLEEGYASTPFVPYEEVNTASNKVPQKNKVVPFTSSKWQLHANAKVIDANTLELNATAGSQFSMVDLYLKPNTNYTISLDQCDGVYKINDDKALSINGTYGQKGTVTFSTGNAKKVTLFFYSTSAGKFIFKNPMIEEGSVKTSYSPYREGNSKASLVPKKNLVSGTGNMLNAVGSVYTIPVNQFFVSSFTPSETDNVTIKSEYEVVTKASGNNRDVIMVVPVKPNTTYKPSCETNGDVHIFFYDSKRTKLGQVYNTVSANLTATTPANCAFIGFCLTNRGLGAGAFSFKNWQLEEGSVATAFEPYSLVPKKADTSLKKVAYKDYPFTFKRESTEILKGVQYRINQPRFKDKALFIEEGVTNTVANSEKVNELKVVNNAYGQVTYNHSLPKKLVVQSTDDKYTLQFEIKPIGTNIKPFGSIVVGSQPPKDSWSWRLYPKDYLPSEIEVLEDGWFRYTKTFTIKGTKGEYLQSFIKFVSELSEPDIDSFIRNVQIEEKPYATSYTTGYRKNETALINASIDKQAGAIEVDFSYTDIPTKSQYVFDANVPRWILYKDAWDDTVYVYLEGTSVIALPKSVIPNGRNKARIEWKDGSSSLYLNGSKIGAGTYTSVNTKGIKPFYLGSRYTGVEQLNNLIYSFKIEDRNGNITYQI
jgi:hypothetical protein